MVLRRVGDIQAVTMAYHIPAGSHPDSSALEVLEAILDESPSGRLYKALVESKKAMSEGGDDFSFTIPSLMIFTAQVRKDGNLEDVEKTMRSGIDGMVKEPPSKEEVDRARNASAEGYRSGIQQFAACRHRVERVLPSMGDWRLLFLDRDRIRESDAGGCGARGEAVSEVFEPDDGPVHPRCEAGSG